MKLLLTLIILASLLLEPTTAFSEGENLRELCRKRVAGEHLKHLDRLHLSEKKLTYAKNQSNGLKLKIKDLAKRIESLEDKLEKEALDFETRQSIKENHNLSNYYASILEANNKKSAIFKKEIKSYGKKLSHWVDSIKPAFKIIRYKSKSSHGYPLEVKYSLDCPTFHTSCPVDLESKNAIGRAFSKNTIPESCSRYIDQN
jgi:hypothetical protein